MGLRVIEAAASGELQMRKPLRGRPGMGGGQGSELLALPYVGFMPGMVVLFDNEAVSQLSIRVRALFWSGV
jgi:hypothetical protein